MSFFTLFFFQTWLFKICLGIQKICNVQCTWYKVSIYLDILKSQIGNPSSFPDPGPRYGNRGSNRLHILAEKWCKMYQLGRDWFSQGSYIRWLLRNRCAHIEGSRLFGMLFTFLKIQSNKNMIFFLQTKPLFSFISAKHATNYHLI